MSLHKSLRHHFVPPLHPPAQRALAARRGGFRMCCSVLLLLVVLQPTQCSVPLLNLNDRLDLNRDIQRQRVRSDRRPTHGRVESALPLPSASSLFPVQLTGQAGRSQLSLSLSMWNVTPCGG